jgi:hypothetical protein
MKLIALLCTVIVGWPVTSAVQAGDLSELITTSSLIVVGRAEAPGSATSALGGPSQTVVVSTDRVLKGNAHGQIVVQVDQSNPDFGSIRPQQYGIFILNSNARGGVYIPADPYRPALIASPTGATNTGSGDPLTSVTRELVGVLAKQPARLVGSSDPAAAQMSYSEAAASLEELPAQIVVPILRPVAKSSSGIGAVWGAAALLTLDSGPGSDDRQSQYLDLVKPFLLKPDPNLAFTVSVVANAVQANVKSSLAVPTLTTLLASPAVSVRRAASSALSDIATKTVIAPLATMALKDPDQSVRYYAVLGLAEATGVTKPPTLPSFKQNEVAMLGFWRNWARTNLPASN